MTRNPLPVAFLLLVGILGPAAAACSAPSAPDPAGRPTKPALPVKPPCADAKPGAAGCLGWEAYSYNDAIKAYNGDLATWKKAADAYVERLNGYVKASGEYARCEVQSMQ